MNHATQTWPKVGSGGKWFTEARRIRPERVALSYAWGDAAQPRSNRSTTWKSLASAPLVVQDAATVTLALGLRYLWVDRYCINQAKAVEKAQNIRNMDQIFERAELVICAAAGNGADSGLPGISSFSRIPQPVCMLEKFELRSTLPNVKWAVSHSRWNTRGWTLQEARLARRCLFFTKFQMYFVCRTNTRSESIHNDSIGNDLESFMNDFTLDSSLFADIRNVNNRGHDMFLDIHMFSHRVLSSGSDALNAMRGILTRSPFSTF